MDISVVLDTVDRLFNENKPEEVESLLLGAISVALEDQDGIAMLQLLNELIGYYRETGRYEDAYKIAEEIENIADQILPAESIPYATSSLNIATAYRAGGRLEDALEIYGRVEAIYAKILDRDNMLMASLYNNESLLYQEMGDFEKSRDCLQKALKIVTSKGEHYEEAVSRANLAGTCIQLGELEEGYEQAVQAIELFTELDVNDGHFAAALSALGSYYYIKGEFESGAVIFSKAMEAMEKSLGRNDFYRRLEENYKACIEAADLEAENMEYTDSEYGEELFAEEGLGAEPEWDGITGMELCREYFELYGAPVIAEKFPEYIDKIAVGLAGEGSDCFGFDDEISRDHDWGPGFCIWMSDEVYDAIGDSMQKAYDELPDEFMGVKRAPEVQGKNRRGVVKMSDFCKRLLGTAVDMPEKVRDEIDWQSISDAGLAAFINGEIWHDPHGLMSDLREEISKGYPENIRYLKLAESCGRFSQTGQYNYNRCIQRGDDVSAEIMKADAIREAMKICFYMENKFPPHDKWLYKAIDHLEIGEALKLALESLVSAEPEQVKQLMEKIGVYLAMALYGRDIISDVDSYLDHHTDELVAKSFYASETNEELSLHIAKEEFKAFDKVQNEGGRASCQNNWVTFGVMRQSQYLTWTRPMLLQYLYDFERETKLGHNLITEKYGRMMESTAPERYAEIKDNFPVLSEEKKQIIEAVCAIQVGWMENFAERYPKLAGQARSVHSYEDMAYNTSYETYLRGEISTYSDKMLELYARFIVELSQKGENLAEMTMKNSCRLYGYESLEDAEAKS